VRCPPGTISLPVAAVRMRLNYRTVCGLIRRGALRGWRRGHRRHWYVSEADVAAHIAVRVAGTLDTLTTSQQESVA